MRLDIRKIENLKDNQEIIGGQSQGQNRKEQDGPTLQTG